LFLDFLDRSPGEAGDVGGHFVMLVLEVDAGGIGRHGRRRVDRKCEVSEEVVTGELLMTPGQD
jgi:hypothetical protein